VYAHCQVRVCVSVSAFVPMCTLVVVYGCLYECMCMPLSVRESIRGEQHMQYCWHLISLRIQVRLAKAVYMHTVYDRIFCDFSAGILYRFTPYVYGSGHVQLTSLFELKHAHTRTHIYTHTYIHTHIRTHTLIHTHTHTSLVCTQTIFSCSREVKPVFVHTHTHIHTLTHTRLDITHVIFSCSREVEPVLVHTYTHIRTHTLIHTHTHTPLVCTQTIFSCIREVEPVLVHAHTHIHTHTHTCTHTQTRLDITHVI